ncbi:MAG: hypothetical protein ACI8RD_013214, partial [Bacillariaceae sp.]
DISNVSGLFVSSLSPSRSQSIDYHSEGEQ